MANMTQQKDGSVYVIPQDYDEAEFEISEDQLIFERFAGEAKDNDEYSKLTVSRVPMNRHGQRGAQKLSFLFETAIDEYSYSQLLGKLRDEYGSGFYKIQARNEKGQLKLNKTVAVEAPGSDTDKASADNPTSLVIDQFSRSLAEQQSEMREFMMSQKSPSGPDMIDQIVKISGAVAPILAALGLSRPEPAPPPKTLVDQLAEVKMIQELMGGNNDTQYGEANGWSALTETLKALGPAIGGALAMGATVPATPDAVPQIAAPVIESPEDDKLNELSAHEKVMQDNKNSLQKQIGMLLIQAKGDANPLEVAELVVNMTPSEHEEKLWDTISDENCVDTMVAVVPEVSEYREWFDALRLGIIDLMAEPETPAEDLRGDGMAALAEDREKETLTNVVELDKNSESPAVVGAEPDIDGTDGDTPRTP